MPIDFDRTAIQQWIRHLAGLEAMLGEAAVRFYAAGLNPADQPVVSEIATHYWKAIANAEHLLSQAPNVPWTAEQRDVVHAHGERLNQLLG